MFRYIKRLFKYRELLVSLSLKDFKVRYKSAYLGFLWSILNPLFLMVVFSIVFSFVAKIQIEKYPIFLLVGLIPWTFFSLSLSNTTHSIIDNANLIKKINFPRAVIPLSIILANLYNFLLSQIVLFMFLLVANNKDAAPRFIPISISIDSRAIFRLYSLLTKTSLTRYRGWSDLSEISILTPWGVVIMPAFIVNPQSKSSFRRILLNIRLYLIFLRHFFRGTKQQIKLTNAFIIYLCMLRYYLF